MGCGHIILGRSRTAITACLSCDSDDTMHRFVANLRTPVLYARHPPLQGRLIVNEVS